MLMQHIRMSLRFQRFPAPSTHDTALHCSKVLRLWQIMVSLSLGQSCNEGMSSWPGLQAFGMTLLVQQLSQLHLKSGVPDVSLAENYHIVDALQRPLLILLEMAQAICEDPQNCLIAKQTLQHSKCLVWRTTSRQLSFPDATGSPAQIHAFQLQGSN